jgi:hypothetical protein
MRDMESLTLATGRLRKDWTIVGSTRSQVSLTPPIDTVVLHRNNYFALQTYIFL